MDGVLGLTSDPRSVAAAARAGFQGLQVTLGSNRKGKPMPMAVGETQQSFVAESKKHGVALASARAGNVIGGGDWAGDRLIPDMLRAVAAGQPVVIRSPHAIRPWQHVLEPLMGYLSLAEKMWGNGPEFSESWNFGPNDDDAKPVEWIVNKMTDQWGDGATWKMDGHEHPHEAHYLKLDCSKAKSRLNWRPRWNIEQAIERIIAWHRAYLAGENMREITLKQIGGYQG